MAKLVRVACVAAAFLVAPITAVGEPIALHDVTARGAALDGTMAAGEYTSTFHGVNSGFGGIIGVGTSMGLETDVLGNLAFGLAGSAAAPCDPGRVIVLYLDVRSGGFASTTAFTDAADIHRAAASGLSALGPDRADLTFAPGFEADFAVTVDSAGAELWELRGGESHVLVRSLTALPATSWSESCNHELGGMTLADLGLAPGGSFSWIATLLDAASVAGPYRSDEFHGVASTTISVNPGTSPLALAAGDSNHFTSVQVTLNELDADTPGTDVAEFVELYDGGAGGVDLSGLTLVFFNGATDTSYAAFDLDGFSTLPQGFFVAGNAGVPTAGVIFNSNTLQNGADAVALYLDDAASFPNGTPVTNIQLVDALVYGTSDADDPELLAVLAPGGIQVDENGLGTGTLVSMQRCGAVWGLAAPTPGSAAACGVCGDGVLDVGEVCDDGDGQDTIGCRSDCSGCAVDWYGPLCSTFCSAATTCSGNGTCGLDGGCSCDADWYGADCATFCSAAATCSGNGTCDTSGACLCDDGYSAADCLTTTCGDGFAVGAEECDDANTSSGDGCSSSCTLETPSSPDSGGGCGCGPRGGEAEPLAALLLLAAAMARRRRGDGPLARTR